MPPHLHVTCAMQAQTHVSPNPNENNKGVHNHKIQYHKNPRVTVSLSCKNRVWKQKKITNNLCVSVKVSGGVCMCVFFQVSCMHFMHLLLCMHSHTFSLSSILSLQRLSQTYYTHPHFLSLKPRSILITLIWFLSVFLHCFYSVSSSTQCSCSRWFCRL